LEKEKYLGQKQEKMLKISRAKTGEDVEKFMIFSLSGILITTQLVRGYRHFKDKKRNFQRFKRNTFNF